MEAEQVLARYAEVISSQVADYQGNLLETDEKGAPLLAENVNIEKNYKRPVEERHQFSNISLEMRKLTLYQLMVQVFGMLSGVS